MDRHVHIHQNLNEIDQHDLVQVHDSSPLRGVYMLFFVCVVMYPSIDALHEMIFPKPNLGSPLFPPTNHWSPLFPKPNHSSLWLPWTISDPHFSQQSLIIIVPNPQSLIIVCPTWTLLCSWSQTLFLVIFTSNKIIIPFIAISNLLSAIYCFLFCILL